MIGIHPEGFSWTLKKGETFQTSGGGTRLFRRGTRKDEQDHFTGFIANVLQEDTGEIVSDRW